MQFSLIIPAYNEQDLIESALDPIADFLGKHFQNSEIIVVDDGSTDNTGVILDRIAQKHTWNVSFKVLQNAENRGKGYSVQKGMLAAGGEVRVFMDADLPFHLDALLKMYELIDDGYDLVIGDRNHAQTRRVDVSPLRIFAGKVYSSFIRLLIKDGITDTQCGLKGFSASSAALIFNRTTIPGFGFDVEVLRIAQKHNLKIMRIPVDMIRNRKESKVHILRDSVRMLFDLARIRHRERKGQYD